MTDEPPPGPVPVTVEVSDAQHEVPVDVDRWAELARAVLADHEVTGALELCFVDTATIAELNRRHLGEDRPTDVLAFPLDALDDDPVGPVVLGSVVVCPAVAAAQARDAGRDPDDELALLVVHGVLHVLGHDHAEPDETRRMRAAEAAALAAHHRLGS